MLVACLPFMLATGNADILTTYQQPEYFAFFQIPVLIGTILIGRVIEGKNVTDLVRPFSFRQLALGFATGSLIIGVFVVLQLGLGLTEFSWNGLRADKLILSLIAYALVAVNEELLFRQFLHTHLIKKMNINYAILLGAALFSIAHISNDHFNWIGFINIALFGLLASLYYKRYQNLSVPIGAHFSWNLLQGPFFGYPVSGYARPSVLNTDINHHNFYLNGGSFGAEGSLLLIPITLAFIYYERNQKLKKT